MSTYYGRRGTGVIGDMIGKTIAKVDYGAVGDDAITFTDTDGVQYQFWYEPDCCANCSIEEVVGDLNDLVGSPIVMAEEVTNEPEPETPGEYQPESYTWTFYKFATVKGYVTIRWYGTSNGYYSESVSYRTFNPAQEEE